MSRITLQSFLRRLIWASMLPLLALAAYLAFTYVDTVSAEAEDAADQKARNIASYIDGQIDAQVRGLRTIAASPLLQDPPRLGEFYREAQAFRESFGTHVLLADSQLQMLLNTRSEYGAPLPRLPIARGPGQAAAPVALETGRPAIGDIVVGPVALQTLVAIAVPVMRDGKPHYVLLGTIETRQLQEQLRHLVLPRGWTLTLLDGAGSVIASHPAPPPGVPSVAPAGGVRHVVRAAQARWQVVLDIAPEARLAPRTVAASVFLLVLVGAVLAGLFLGHLSSRRLVQAVDSLARAPGAEASAATTVEEVEAVRMKLAQAAAALGESEERYRTLFAANPQPMWVYDLETLRFLAVNDAAVARYGYSEAEFLSMTIADIRPTEDVARLNENVAQVLDGSRGAGLDRAGVWRHLTKDGTLIAVEITSHLLDFAGRRAEAVLANDITDRLRNEELLRTNVAQLEKAMMGSVKAISRMMDLRDPYTAGHEQRVGEIAAAIAAEMGLPAEMQRGLRVAGAVHDIGKITIPTEILVKPSKLNKAEFEIVKAHPAEGYEILKDLDFPWPVAETARQHHERIDGSGYPRGLKGDEIILEARILAVADVVEAMTSHRPYRPTLGVEKSLAEIEEGAGRVYDAEAAAACLRMFREHGYRLPE